MYRFNLYRWAADQSTSHLVNIFHQATPQPERYAHSILKSNCMTRPHCGYVAIFDGAECVKIINAG